MFRYLARRHDRKHILRSLQRQKRIGRRSIEFGFDTRLAFAINEAEDIYASSGELAFREISEAGLFFSPILPPEPLREERNSVTFLSDITTGDEQNNAWSLIADRKIMHLLCFIIGTHGTAITVSPSSLLQRA
ncbi:hypothetical protein [Sinorhizobium meliloti]|uniref:hypothetical protein n=1 Tax=Rhizobium meliloti TaxID=382 RepID=UPI001F226686|nr:hypothetical protein [Sinorhizobium meliloti]